MPVPSRLRHPGERPPTSVAPRRSRPSARALATLLLAAALVSGCSGAASARPTVPSTHPSAPSTTTTTVPLPPVVPVVWTPCGGLQCGWVTVPLDYARPAGPTIQIAVARHPAEEPSERIGSLVINPGGPGGSGIDDLPNELSVMPAELLDRFDIVSFDPRGVERSDPVSCAPSAPTTPTPTVGGGSGPSGQLIDPVPTTPAAEVALLANDRTFAAQCERASAGILPYVGTVDTARDLDRIRQALGDVQLTYFGHSYGTLLGATYATLFPTHVRAMVLDGSIDPALTTVQYATDQAESYEAELTSFFSWCAATPSCPWRPSGDPTQALLAVIQQSRVRPLSVSDGGTAGPGEIYDALLAGLESQSSWPTLAGALAAAAQGNGTEVATMSGRYETGGSSNGAEAEQAIDCVDHPVDRDPARLSGPRRPGGDGRPGVRPTACVGPAGVRHLAGPPHPHPRTGVGSGGTTDPGGRDYR